MLFSFFPQVIHSFVNNWITQVNKNRPKMCFSKSLYYNDLQR